MESHQSSPESESLFSGKDDADDNGGEERGKNVISIPASTSKLMTQ